MAVIQTTEPLARPVGSTELFERWRRKHDRRARDVLIERFLPLARKLARRYAASDEPYDDLVQVASLGLVKAVERFDPDRGFAFTSFAVPTIVGELKRYFRDTAWALHVDRSAQERARRIAQARREISTVRGRAPTVGELAEYLELSREEILDGLQVSEAYDTVSLDAPPRATATAWSTGWRRSAMRTAGWRGSMNRRPSSRPPSVCPSESDTSCSCASVRT